MTPVGKRLPNLQTAFPLNYHKNTDSSTPLRRESRKRALNVTVVLLSKHGFSIEVLDPLPEPAGAPPPVSGKNRKRRWRGR